MPKNIARTISDSVPGSRESSPAFQLYDAIREQQPDNGGTESERVRREKLRRALVADELDKEEGISDEMNNFISLLREHLTRRFIHGRTR
jgi:hypothetical protein